MNLMLGKIVVAVKADGSEHTVRLTDKLLFNGSDMYLCVCLDGSTFLTNYIKRVMEKSEANPIWNNHFSLMFTDSQNIA